MAGSSMTFTYDREGPIVKVIADWVSDSATGAVSGTTTAKVSGRLVKCVTDPGATAPDANYDIDITDAESVNVLTAAQVTLANRHTTSTEEVYFLVKDAAPLAQSIHPVVCDLLTFSITNAGNSKNGQIILYVDGNIYGGA